MNDRMRRILWSLALASCGSTTSDVVFPCGDAGATCHSSTEYCQILTATGGVRADSGGPPASEAQCAPLIDACTTCECLMDAGAGAGCVGEGKCTAIGSALTINISCPQ